jgi:hypothetical protein
MRLRHRLYPPSSDSDDAALLHNITSIHQGLRSTTSFDMKHVYNRRTPKNAIGSSLTIISSCLKHSKGTDSKHDFSGDDTGGHRKLISFDHIHLYFSTDS